MSELPAGALVDATAEQLDQARTINRVIELQMPGMPSFRTAEGLAAHRTGGVLAFPDVEDVIEDAVPGPAGDIPVRLLRPSGQPRGVCVHLHGGGWCIGSAKEADFLNDELARATGLAVVAVDYRLGPEDPFPAGPDDAEAVAVHVLDHLAAELGTDTLFLAGVSAGAHLSVVTALRLRDRHGPEAIARCGGLLLEAGLYDMGLTPSARAAADGLVIPLEVIEACIDNALPGTSLEARRDPAWSPLFAELAGLPPALFVVGTLDPLLDDSLGLHERWLAAGNEAELAVYPESVHGFSAFPTAMGTAARERVAAFVRARLDERAATPA